MRQRRALVFALILACASLVPTWAEAADRYWVGGSGTWDASDTSHWSATSGGASGASVPTSSDNAIFDSLSHTTDYTLTLASVSKPTANLTFGAPLAGNLTVTGGDGWDLSIYGNFSRYSGIVWTTRSEIHFRATSGTKTIASNGGKWRNRFVINGSGGTFQLLDTLAFDNIDANGLTQLIMTAGTFDANGQKVHFESGSSSLRYVNGSFTFFDFQSDGQASKTVVLEIFSNITVSGTLTLAGNSAVNRQLIRSSARGTARTITSATNAISNADFQDITGAGAASWNLSAITGLSGDCGGNSGITFTPPVTNYWVGGTGNWDAVAEWASSSGGSGGTGRVPLPQDTARFDANSFSAGSQTVTQNMTRIGSMDWTGVTNTPTLTTSTAASVFGSITLVSGMTLTGSTPAYTFEGRGSYTIANAGKTWAKGLLIDAPGSSYTLQDALLTTGPFTLASGTIAAGIFNVTAFNFVSVGTPTRAYTGSGTWTMTGDISAIWSTSGSGLTPSTAASIRITTAMAGDRTFAGGGYTYGNLEIATTGAFAFRFSGSNTFNTLHVDASAAARTVLFTAGTTTTVANFTRNAGTNVITIGSITAASHTLTKSGGGRISLDYLSISRSTGTPALKWYAGANSTDGGNNSGWVFTVPPNKFISIQ